MQTANEPSEILEGRFRLESERIHGGMGIVYRAVDLQTHERVAVKISTTFGSQLGERFQHEANCLAGIAHPAIVRYIAHGRTHRGEHYLVMEWLDGETLEDRLQRCLFTLSDALRVVRRIGEALTVAHQHGIIHRDIKPANVFLPGRDLAKVKLLDFGIARRLFEPPHQRLTQAGSALGTPMYMAPEQARGAPTIDIRADIFSLGCVLFECVTGAPPFGGDSGTAAFLQAAEGQATQDVAQRLESHSPQLAELVGHMLAERPEDRPSSVQEVLQAMEKITLELRATGVLPQVPIEITGKTTLVSPLERRLTVVLLIEPKRPWSRPPLLRYMASNDLGSMVTRGLGEGEPSEADLAKLNPTLAAFGATLSMRPDGRYLLSLFSEGTLTPFDLVSRATLTALRIKQAWAEWSFALGMGYVQLEGERTLDFLLARVLPLFEQTKPGTIVLGQDLRRLLEPRFELGELPHSRLRVLFEKSLRDAPRTVLGREIPCLGREREISNLESIFDECVEESCAQVMLVSGAAGLGKSRIAHEFLARIQRRGEPFALLVGRGDPMRTNVSLGMVGQALREAAGISGSEPEETQRKRLLAHVSRHLPKPKAENIAAFLGEIAGIPFPDEHLPQLQAARLDARLMADQTKAAWVDWLEAEVEHQPILVMFEDMHLCDQPSMIYMDAVLRVLREKPLLLVALGRPEMDIRFPALWRERHPQRSCLSPLSNRAIESLIRAIDQNLTEQQFQWIVDRGQGNPYYLEELVRSVHEHPELSEIPDTVVGMVQMRFDAVGEGGKNVLRAGSVFGQRFWAGGIKALLHEMDVDDVDRWLEILVSKEILYSHPAANDDEFSFRFALYYETAYALLSPEQREVGHRMAAEYLEAQPNPDAVVLAHHFELGKQPARAVHWLCIAADQALEVDDLDASLHRVAWGIRLGAAGDELAHLSIAESEVHFWRGEYVDAERLARTGQTASNPVLRLRATNALIDSLGPRAEYTTIQALTDQLMAQPGEGETRFPWLLCVASATSYLFVAGDFQRGRNTLELLEAEGESLPLRLQAQTELLRSSLARLDGRLVETMRRCKTAAEIFEDMGNHRRAMAAGFNVGVAQAELGLLSEADEILRPILSSAEKRDLKYLLGALLQALCGICLYQGRLAEAREFGKRALDLTSELQDYRFKGAALIYLSQVEFFAGDYNQAETHAQAATEVLRDLQSSLPFAYAVLARSLLKQNRLGEAATYADLARHQLETLGDLDDGEAVVRLVHIECLMATQQEEKAKLSLEKALAKLNVKALTIEAPAMREAFFRHISEHRQIVELARHYNLISLLS